MLDQHSPRPWPLHLITEKARESGEPTTCLLCGESVGFNEESGDCCLDSELERRSMLLELPHRFRECRPGHELRLAQRSQEAEDRAALAQIEAEDERGL